MILRFTARASAGVAAILSQISRDNRRAAIDVAARIEQFSRVLAEQPGMGHASSKLGVRVCPIPGLPYLIYFRVRGPEVQILRVRDARRRPLDRP
ncbi:type II toxin-antitoxin system RelE/ParE family toxin [uncultured Enterovirga sp.]|uniref:type II toxin-antitoxin system RelE/ParE family toxin n=1 Tax=uncultured Enterovirga sp. TaxID=2026352 RepID=UPI0035CBA4DD